MHRSSFNVTMNTLIILLFTAYLRTASPGSVQETEDAEDRNMSSRLNSSMESDRSVEEKMKQLRIEMVKFQILTKLNMKEPPQSVAALSEASREAIKLLMKETDEQQRTQYEPLESEELLIIQAENCHMKCLRNNESYCKMFQFGMHPNLNSSSLDLWIYKLTEFPRWLSVSHSFSSSTEEKYYDRLYYEVKKVGWSKLQLPAILIPSSWNDTVTYSLEIVGQNIENHGERCPFLTVSKSSYMASRQRRDITSCDTNESCCLVPLRISFAAIGFNFVVHPEELQANMCTGKCRLDPSEQRTHYERAMTKVLESDRTLQESLGECWTLCCKPRQLGNMTVIYEDMNKTLHIQDIPELIVKSCSCT